MKNRPVSVLLAVALMLSMGLVGCASEQLPEVTEYTLTISSSEGGLVTAPGEQTYTYDEGAVVNLIAEAEEGYHFVIWTGDVSMITDTNAASTIITMNDNYSVIASFAYAEPLAAVWNGDARFVADWRQFSPLAMHFLSVWDENHVYWVFHIRNYKKGGDSLGHRSGNHNTGHQL